MGKHSIEEKNNNKLFGILILIVIIIIAIYFWGININYKNESNSQTKVLKQIPSYTIGTKTIEGEKLVIKSNSDYNKYIEYIFENNIISKVNVYEQFENEEMYNNKKDKYNKQENINVTKYNDKEFVIEIEKLNLGTDEGLTYEDIYDKYVIQIVGAYEVIK